MGDDIGEPCVVTRNVERDKPCGRMWRTSLLVDEEKSCCWGLLGRVQTFPPERVTGAILSRTGTYSA